MAVKSDNQIKLQDGHLVGYAEYGDLQGKPVLHFHGLPSSRLELHRSAIEQIAERLHARVIVVERPGIGLSDYYPYTIVSWPNIVTEFADALHLERFAVMGLSSGGKYAAACAWKIPDRLTAAGILNGSCPFDLPGAKETLSKEDRQVYHLADKVPWRFGLVLGKVARDIRKDPTSFFSLFTEVSEPDRRALELADVKESFEEMVTEAFHQGTRGVALDWKLESRSWGFSLEEIRMPVTIWHGEMDTIVPVEQAHILKKFIPTTHVTFFPDEGHVSLLVHHYEEILAPMVS